MFATLLRDPSHQLCVRRLLVSRAAWCLALVHALAACTPALDWRELQPPGWSLQFGLPCRPAAHTRTVPLAGQAVALSVMACSAQDHTFAVSMTTLASPAAVAPALQALGVAARANLAGQVSQEQPALVPGMTPHDAARRWRLSGKLPDGQPAVAEVLVFAHGLQVYQATVLGRSVGPAQLQPFLDALRVRP